MSFSHAAILFVAGLIAGAMNSIAGGGTILTFPALIFLGLPAIAANATSTVALLPGSFAGALGYRKNLGSVAPWIRRFALVSFLGGLIGGVLLTRTPPELFEWMVPFLILFATALFSARGFFSRCLRRAAPRDAMAAEPHGQRADGQAPDTRWFVMAVTFQFAVAIYGGYFGAGIGILMLASLGMLGVGHVHELNAVKNVLALFINFVAAAYFCWSGLVHWWAGAAMGFGAICGGYGGAHLAQKISRSAVQRIITVIGFVLAGVMFAKQFSHR